jgi:elongation factor G
MSAFPPRPLRGIRARFVRQAGCPSDFAAVTVDFEPWEEGFAFEVAPGATLLGNPGQHDLATYHTALVAGMRAELAELPADLVVAVAVVLHCTVVHDVDSHAGAFHQAGRVAVREALTQAYGRAARAFGRAATGSATGAGPPDERWLNVSAAGPP